MINKLTNPYTTITGLVVPVVQTIKGISFIDGSPVADEYYAEADNYIRLYTGLARRKHIFSLSIKARDLYLLMLYNLNDDYEHVVLSYSKVNAIHREMGATKDMYRRGFKELVKELISNNIIDIKDAKKEYYWLNPHYFFPGDRSKKYPDNMRVIRVRDLRTAEEQAKLPRAVLR